ncbi:hypothetical protein [Ureaplasma urealyticum]|uniref:hypothetical protein n=1 Tax=Ureaplasma urealyticum TaxID=2130 RepID=UPI0002F4F764|nr:hypothetical protein [Ureaplasma urealyticum]
MTNNQNSWKKIDLNTKYTILEYLKIVDNNNELIVDNIFKKYMLENQFNFEFLGSVTIKPTKIMDDMQTAIYEIDAIEQIEEYRDDFKQNQTPAIDRLILHLNNNYQKEINISVFDKKTSAQWNDFLYKTLANLEIVKQDQINLINIDAIYQSCLATGNYIVIPELSPNNVESLTNDKQLEIVEKIYRKAKQLNKSCVIFNLGNNTPKLKCIFSNFSSQIFLNAKIHNAIKAPIYDYYSNKSLGSKMQFLFDYLNMSIYKSEFLEENFLKLAGMIVFPKSITCFKQELMLKTFQNEVEKSHLTIYNLWSINSVALPQFAHLNIVILNAEPSKDEIDKAHSNLYSQFPSLYTKFK